MMQNSTMLVNKFISSNPCLNIVMNYIDEFMSHLIELAVAVNMEIA